MRRHTTLMNCDFDTQEVGDKFHHICKHCNGRAVTDRPHCQKTCLALPKDGVSLVSRFAMEQAKWLAAGMPRRENASETLETICKPCEHYTKGTCAICGCGLKGKVEMATTHCPIGKW